MSPLTIRNKLIAQLGQDKYKELVLSLYEEFPLRTKLLFWQERLINEVFKELDIAWDNVAQLFSIFNHCPLHHLELRKDNVPIVDGNTYQSALTLREEKLLFPLANVIVPRNLELRNYPQRIDVVYCPGCREERSSALGKPA